jgi:hypothetical protein
MYKTLDKQEILEALAYMAIDTLPENSRTKANITVEYNENGGVDIIICPDIDEKDLN